MSEYQKTNPTHGQKNTSDPAYTNDPKKEHSGTVLSDSLAADSLRSGGGFSDGNPTGISGASSKNTTVNKGDDTIGVRRVHDSDTVDSGKSSRFQNSGENFVREDGGYRASDDSQSTANVSGSKDPQSVESSKKDDGEAGRNRGAGHRDGPHIVDQQPEIGSEDDPGRLAEQKFIERNARSEGVLMDQGGQGGSLNQYDSLDNDRAI